MTENLRLHLTDEEIEIGMEVWAQWAFPRKAVVTAKGRKGILVSSNGAGPTPMSSRNLYRTKLDLLRAQVQNHEHNIAVEEGFLADAERRLAEEEERAS